MFDKNLYWTGIIYFVGLFLLGVIWWKALIVGIVAAICWYLNYSRRSVLALGMVALCLGLGIWVGLLPAVSQWGEWLAALRG
jgi:hypothetical protein